MRRGLFHEDDRRQASGGKLLVHQHSMSSMVFGCVSNVFPAVLDEKLQCGEQWCSGTESDVGRPGAARLARWHHSKETLGNKGLSHYCSLLLLPTAFHAVVSQISAHFLANLECLLSVEGFLCANCQIVRLCPLYLLQSGAATCTGPKRDAQSRQISCRMQIAYKLTSMEVSQQKYIK